MDVSESTKNSFKIERHGCHISNLTDGLFKESRLDVIQNAKLSPLHLGAGMSFRFEPMYLTLLVNLLLALTKIKYQTYAKLEHIN
jgi:hypothetical protein